MIVVKGLGDGAEIDIALSAVGLLEILQTLLDQRGVEPVAVFDGEGGTQGLGVVDGLVAGEGDGAKAVAATFLNRHQNVDPLALVGPKGKEVETAFVANLRLGLFDRRIGVALVAIGQADALGVLFKLGGVKGLREEILKEDGVRNADGLEVLHGAAQHQAGNMLVAGELDVAHLDGGAFLDIEVDLNRSRRDVLDVQLYNGELVSVLGEQIFEDGGGAQNLGRVVLALHGHADLFLLEAVENVGRGDRVVALVVDFADGRLFLDEDIEDDAFLCVFAFDAQIFEVAGVPERVEIALDGDGVVDIAGVGEEPRQDGFLGDAPVADHADGIDGLRTLSQCRAGGHCQHQRQPDAEQARGPRNAVDECVLGLHRAGALRRAQILVRAIVRLLVRLHGKNIDTLTAEEKICPASCIEERIDYI